jgi:hypothetical protein
VEDELGVLLGVTARNGTLETTGTAFVDEVTVPMLGLNLFAQIFWIPETDSIELYT